MTTVIATFPVLAGAYRTSDPKSFLTHACEVDTDGSPVRVLCKRVKFGSVLDDLYSATVLRPSCEACQAQLARGDFRWFRYELAPNQSSFKVSLHRPKPPALTPNASKVDYAHLNLIEHRKRGFAEARRVHDKQYDEINAMRLERSARRQALDRIAQEMSDAQDRVNAKYPMAQGVELDDDDLEPNASSKLEWVKGDGVDRDGHNLTWWKNKVAKIRSEYDRPRVFIQVRKWDRTGASTREAWPEFAVGELNEAKAHAKEYTERTGGTAQVEGRVVIPYQNSITIDLGEWKNTASNGFYVWSVDAKTLMPVTCRGPFTSLDEAVALAKRSAAAGQTYDEVVTFGGDPEAGDFEVVKSFKAWSGEVHYQTDLPKVGGRLREYRR